jgi:hypothetical protein
MNDLITLKKIYKKYIISLFLYEIIFFFGQFNYFFLFFLLLERPWYHSEIRLFIL